MSFDVLDVISSVKSSMNEFNEQSVYSRIADELLDDSRQAIDHT